MHGADQGFVVAIVGLQDQSVGAKVAGGFNKLQKQGDRCSNSEVAF